MCAGKREQLTFPCAAKTILKYYNKRLTPQERKELPSYDIVYYMGRDITSLQNWKLYRRAKVKSVINYNEWKKHEQIAYRFEVLYKLGEGSYGKVFSACDHKSNKEVAIKIFNNPVNLTQFSRETRISNYLKEKGTCEYFVEIYEHFQFRGFYLIVFEKLHDNLSSVIVSRRATRFGKTNLTYGQELINEYAYNLFRCLLHLKKHNVFHSDIRPDNILIVTKGRPSIKICDFGLSCYYSEIKKHKLQQSLYYKAPEVLLGAEIDPAAVDMWASVCVVAELHIGKILFAGENDVDILSLMMAIMGMPSNEFLGRCRPYLVDRIFDKEGFPRYCTKKSNKIVAKPSPIFKTERFPPGSTQLLETLMVTGDVDLLLNDFLSHCLKWDARERLSVEQAMLHPYLQRRVPKFDNFQRTPKFKQIKSQLGQYKSSLSLTLRRMDNKSKSGAF